MTRITFAVAAAAAIFMTAPVSGSMANPAPGLQMAQVDIEVGRDRDRDYRYRDRDRDGSDRRDRDFTVGIGPGGVRVGPRGRCRTVTTWIERDDGRRVKRTERRCD